MANVMWHDAKTKKQCKEVFTVYKFCIKNISALLTSCSVYLSIGTVSPTLQSQINSKRNYSKEKHIIFVPYSTILFGSYFTVFKKEITFEINSFGVFNFTKVIKLNVNQVYYLSTYIRAVQNSYWLFILRHWTYSFQGLFHSVYLFC